MMIRTLALNPAIDQTVRLDRLMPGEVLRADASRLDPGGKAVNVASCLADWGMKVVVTGLLGRDNAAAFEQLFAAKGIADHMIRVAGATRTNIKLLEADGRTTDVNLPGFTAGAADIKAVSNQLAHAGAGDLVVISGSQPPGLPEDLSECGGRSGAAGRARDPRCQRRAVGPRAGRPARGAALCHQAEPARA